MSAIDFESVPTCPHCGFAKREIMPTDACQFYYGCSNCKVLLRIFFGSEKCPPVQECVAAASSARLNVQISTMFVRSA